MSKTLVFNLYKYALVLFQAVILEMFHFSLEAHKLHKDQKTKLTLYLVVHVYRTCIKQFICKDEFGRKTIQYIFHHCHHITVYFIFN